MLIEELTRQVSLDLLAGTRLGRLACAQGSQPYVVPFYFAYHHNYLYSFSTVGQKIEWMRANPLVCVEVDEVLSPHKWLSVIVFGRYEELPDTPESQPEREFAWKLLQRYAMWWEPSYAKTILHGRERLPEPIFYRIYIARMTGHRATLERATPSDTEFSMTDPDEGGWLQRILWLVRGKFKRSSF
jgi:nitroimidazol reductase NimA-like FMN-containing flavoprotein (pyridoxamine 5'-phosphate oxidase superfamily)